MGKIFYDATDGKDYVYLNDGERLFFVSVYTDPPYIHPDFQQEVQASSGYVIAPDEKMAKKNFMRRKSTKAEIAAVADGAKVARINADDWTIGICQHCGLMSGH